VCDPECALDAVVERLLCAVIIDRTAEGETQEAAAVDGTAPEVGADQRVGTKSPRGLFAGFADHRFHEGFTILEVSGRLIEHQAAGDPLLDHEKAAVELGDRGHGDLGIPGHG